MENSNTPKAPKHKLDSPSSDSSIGEEITKANTSTNFHRKQNSFAFKDSINLDSVYSDDDYSEK